MSVNLNDSLYQRFGLVVEKGQVESGFRSFLKNMILTDLKPIIDSDAYQETAKLRALGDKALAEVSRQMFLDHSRYTGFSHFLESTFDDGSISFEKILVRLQILLNVVYKDKFIRYELEQLTSHINLYLQDYPILGVIIREYKTRPPQILPSTSKFSNKEINDVLGLLESEKYRPVLNHFEAGLKELLVAQNQGQLKDVVEDMVTACDEAIKIIFGDRNLGIDHLFKNDRYKKLMINSWEKQLFGALKEYMHKIKHAAEDNYSRDDVELIVSYTAAFLRFIIGRKENYPQSD